MPHAARDDGTSVEADLGTTLDAGTWGCRTAWLPAGARSHVGGDMATWVILQVAFLEVRLPGRPWLPVGAGPHGRLPLSGFPYASDSDCGLNASEGDSFESVFENKFR